MGAAGVACTRTLREFGSGRLVVWDRRGAIHRDREFNKNRIKECVASNTKPDGERGSLAEVIGGAGMLLGLSGQGIMSRRDVQRTNGDPIVFAMNNPTPEIMPVEVEDIVAVMATGRSDYPNQINSILALPGNFRGAPDAGRAPAAERDEPLPRLKEAARSTQDHAPVGSSGDRWRR